MKNAIIVVVVVVVVVGSFSFSFLEHSGCLTTWLVSVK